MCVMKNKRNKQCTQNNQVLLSVVIKYKRFMDVTILKNVIILCK